MNFVRLWERNKKTVYLSYTMIAIVVFGLYIYVFYSWLSLESLRNYLVGIVLLLGLKQIIYKYKREEGDILYIFPVFSLLVLYNFYCAILLSAWPRRMEQFNSLLGIEKTCF